MKRLPPTMLTTPRLVLRPLSEQDKPAFIDGWTRGIDHLRPWLPADDFQRSADQVFAAYRHRQNAGLASGSALRLSVWRAGELTGFVALSTIVRGATQGATLSYHLLPEHLGQGFATEAVGRLLDHGFAADGLRLHRVTAAVMPHNVASLRLAGRLGFRREGYAPKMLKIAGRWQDHVLLAKLAEEH
jgi:ribosomal-protein-alanine N-acetyltransferase